MKIYFIRYQASYDTGSDILTIWSNLKSAEFEIRKLLNSAMFKDFQPALVCSGELKVWCEGLTDWDSNLLKYSSYSNNGVPYDPSCRLFIHEVEVGEYTDLEIAMSDFYIDI